MILPVTLCTAAAMAVLTLWLMMRVGAVRRQAGIAHGDGGNPALARRMRAQVNFVESAPFVLGLVAAIELSGKGSGWLALVAALYVAGRVLHAFGMDRDNVPLPRIIGIAATMLTLLGLAVMAVLIATGIV